METRFLKFIGKRDKATAASTRPSLVTAGTSYTDSAPSPQQPIFIYQPLGKSASELRNSVQADGSPLRSVSYDNAKTGKAPVMGDRPQKGNGPVRLQTSRRLSTGELIVTSQDPRITIQDIRHGEYVVGKKERRVSQPHVRAHHAASQSFTPPSQHSNASPALRYSLTSPLPTTTWSLEPVQEHDTFAMNFESPSKVSIHPGLGLSASSYERRSHSSCDVRRNDDVLALHPSTHEPNQSQYANSLYEFNSNGTATLRALWKAEYSRLANIYGQDHADRNMVQFQQQPSATTIEESQRSGLLDPLPAPFSDIQTRDPRRASALSAMSERSGDGWSGTSSTCRDSYMSSYAASSAPTAPPSIHETDAVTTREDIRKMVEQMRSTYINALEEKVPKTPKSKSKRRSRKPRPSTHTSHPTAIPMHELDVLDLEIEAMVASDKDQTRRSSRRKSSHHSATTGRLSPIQASPFRDDKTDNGLRRADSSTLGAIIGEETRLRIRDRQSGSPSRKLRPVSSATASSTDAERTQSSIETVEDMPLPVTPKPKELGLTDLWLPSDGSHAPPTLQGNLPSNGSVPDIFVLRSGSNNVDDAAEIDEDLTSMYDEFFGASTGSFWSTSTVFNGNDLKTSLGRSMSGRNLLPALPETSTTPTTTTRIAMQSTPPPSGP